MIDDPAAHLTDYELAERDRGQHLVWLGRSDGISPAADTGAAAMILRSSIRGAALRRAANPDLNDDEDRRLLALVER